MNKITIESIKKVICDMKQVARDEGLDYIEVTSKQVHDIVGGYSNGNTRYPSCCRAMYAVMIDGDEIIHTTKSELSSTIIIKYYL